MKKNHIFIKKILPVLLVSVSASSLYFGVAKADEDLRTVFIESVDDVVEIGAGYYDESVFIKTNLTAPETFVSSSYADANNETVLGYEITEDTDTSLEAYNVGDKYSIDVGVNEQITLPSGYYNHDISIKNGDKHRGEIDGTLDGNYKSFTFEAGYYDGGEVILDPSYEFLKGKLSEIFGIPVDSGTTFGQLYEALQGESFVLNRTGKAAFVQRLTGSSQRIGTSAENTEISDIALSGQGINLGVDEMLSIPAGYYNDTIYVYNGVVDRQSGSTVLDGNNKEATLQEGYYSESTISINSTLGSLKQRIADIFGITIADDATFLEIAAQITGDSFNLNRKGTASYTEKKSGTNDRIGTSNSDTEIGNIPLSGETINLGVDETLVIPAGYYDSDITIKNGVVHQDNVDTKVSANNNAAYGSKSVSYGAGYYDSINVSNNTPNGTITVHKKNGTSKKWDPTTQQWVNP